MIELDIHKRWGLFPSTCSFAIKVASSAFLALRAAARVRPCSVLPASKG